MKGDYFRYISEYASGDLHAKASEGALEAYKAASEISNSDLKTTHPIRLGLALNFSVFYYEVMNDPTKVILLILKFFRHATSLNKPSMTLLLKSNILRKTNIKMQPLLCN